MDYFGLRGKHIHVYSAEIYPNSDWKAVSKTSVSDAVLTIHGIVLTTKKRGDSQQVPYAYIKQRLDSGLGIWLNEADYSVLEE